MAVWQIALKGYLDWAGEYQQDEAFPAQLFHVDWKRMVRSACFQTADSRMVLAGYQKEALIEDGVIDEIIQIERHIHQGEIDLILL